VSFLLKYLKNKKVTVLGAGTSGIAVALLLKRKGVKVFISEQQPEKEKYKEKKILGKKGIPFEFGGHSEQIYETDVLVVSPGIALNDIRVKKARERGISVYGELEVAFWYCQAPVIAVTGSNGKSTTTELIGDIFKQAGRKHEVAGNIGRPFAEIADSITKESTAIIEVSSFQLETIKSFHPSVAIFLNLTPDHLDRHISLPEYGKLKARIFENQTEGDYLIYNGQDSYVSKLVKKSKSQKIVFNKKHSSNPCGYIDKEKLIFNIKGETKELIDLNALYLKGKHNAGNALEFVRKKNDVVWINDSKATNVEAVWYALESFDTPIILIAGGRDKDTDFSKLHDQVAKTARLVILLGEAALKMKKMLKGIPVRLVENLEQAVKLADSLANPGDVVLLSPSCASFDMFANFEQRGNTFKTLVNNL